MSASEWYGAADPYDPIGHLEHLVYKVQILKNEYLNYVIDDDAYMADMRALRAQGATAVSAILDTPSARHDARFMVDGFDDALRCTMPTRATIWCGARRGAHARPGHGGGHLHAPDSLNARGAHS